MKSTTYTPEFRAEAVKLVLAQGLTLEEAAQRILMPKGRFCRISECRRAGQVNCGSRIQDESPCSTSKVCAFRST